MVRHAVDWDDRASSRLPHIVTMVEGEEEIEALVTIQGREPIYADAWTTCGPSALHHTATRAREADILPRSVTAAVQHMRAQSPPDCRLPSRLTTMRREGTPPIAGHHSTIRNFIAHPKDKFDKEKKCGVV